MPAITRKPIEVELAFIGPGRLERRGSLIAGGVKPPELGREFGFNALTEVDGEPREPVRGTVQVNLWGAPEDFRELGLYFLGLAELDTSVDPGFHQHHESIRSADGHTALHLIVRRRGAAT